MSHAIGRVTRFEIVVFCSKLPTPDRNDRRRDGGIMNRETPMAATREAEARPKKIRTIQTLRFGTSKVDVKLARKTLREMMKEREQKQRRVPVK
jgi:lactate dehydrogenase-like 2-hydroxyacid dehydrogenase